MFNEEEGERLDEYLQSGAIEVAGIDDDGEFIFAITEKAKIVAPELWEAHEYFVDKSLLELYEKGLMRVTYDENLEATIELTKEGFEIAKQMGVIPIEMDLDDLPDN